MKLEEYDLRLYGLLRRCLLGDYVSPARDSLTPAMRAGMLHSLSSTRVGRRCQCGSSFCRSFETLAQNDAGNPLLVIRFHVLGELHVTCDEQGTVYKIQYLRDERDEDASTRCYALTGDGWEERPIAE
ncbi:MAG TPA: hypothetical protein VME66_08070 [Candidatus Acidoferrales bacterium]|nr:hypothetical protein [Candidatus Acidoferrales bacterium]